MKLSYLLTAGSFFLAFTSSHLFASEKHEVETSMDKLAAEQAIPCETALRTVARENLKQNPHRLLAYQNGDADIHLFNALAVSQYRDRDSHITFHGVENAQGQCFTSVTESYVLNTPCADARHEAFSKWQFQGKLNDNTSVLVSKRIQGKQAFLTEQFSTLCLVTTRQLVEH
ncbi:hypothetical protein [Thaumasiovibrio subtropicus]|uniref:hypothetical protein n=1 Tax=Thaumasiovibrio subtropicus TaxID=1891207 RepID=UPI000B352F97|nr:hypothetical protein [Thaumasiovibrio subtropicus]